MGALLSEPVLAMVADNSASNSWTASTVTMQGWRRTHEDAHILQCSAGGPHESGVFAVLDGHGGTTAAHAGSIILENRLVQFARQGTLNPAAAAKDLVSIFIESDAELREQLAIDDKSGTTVVAAIITKCKPTEYCVQLVHSGDSRAVLCVGGELICTMDHKPQREDEVQRIQAAGGSVISGSLGSGPMRVDGMLAVSRALGDFHFKPVGMNPGLCKVTAMPEVQTVAHCGPGDWLFLACDGVFDVMENEEVKDFVAVRLRNAAPELADGGAILVELLKHCVIKGSKDNCTACLVQFHEDRTPTPPSRQLFQGPWAKATPSVQAKYAQFFISHGFEEEAKALQAATVAEPVVAEHEVQQPEPARVTTASGSGQSNAPTTWTKTWQAMQSIRAIQSAWRARRSKSDGNGSIGSSRSSSRGSKMSK